MPRIATVLAAITAALALASCGRSNPVAGVRTVTATTAAPAPRTGSTPGSSTRPEPSTSTPTAAQARAYAQAVNLRLTDVPGFKPGQQASRREATEEGGFERRIAACLGDARAAVGRLIAPSATLAESGSSEFEREGSDYKLSVKSSVSVSRKATTKGELAALGSHRLLGCLSTSLEAMFKAPSFHGARIGRIAIQYGTPPAAGTTGTFGWRIKVPLLVHSVSVPYYMDILGFAYGRAEVTLMSSGFPLPFPAAAEQQLFALLLARAKSHSL